MAITKALTSVTLERTQKHRQDIFSVTYSDFKEIAEQLNQVGVNTASKRTVILWELIPAYIYC